MAARPAAAAVAGDWPMWRYDAGRTAASPDSLPADLKLSWTRQYVAAPTGVGRPAQSRPDALRPNFRADHRRTPADRRLQRSRQGDRARPRHRRRSVDLLLRRARPVPSGRLAGKVFVASDDGYLYSLDAARGTLLWKFRGAPTPRKAIGNKRVISCWPARGGPVVRDGKVYFAASIWPFMGTFIYALDAETGRVAWVNDGTASEYLLQPHGGALSFAGVAPQGALVATSRTAAGAGRSDAAAAFDRAKRPGAVLSISAEGEGRHRSSCADERHSYVHTRGRGVVACNLHSGTTGEAHVRQVGADQRVEPPRIDEPVLADGGTHQLRRPADRGRRGRLPLPGAPSMAAATSSAPATASMPPGRKTITAVDTAGNTVWSQPVEGEVLRLLAGGGQAGGRHARRADSGLWRAGRRRRADPRELLIGRSFAQDRRSGARHATVSPAARRKRWLCPVVRCRRPGTAWKPQFVRIDRYTWSPSTPMPPKWTPCDGASMQRGLYGSGLPYIRATRSRSSRRRTSRGWSWLAGQLARAVRRTQDAVSRLRIGPAVRRVCSSCPRARVSLIWPHVASQAKLAKARVALRRRGAGSCARDPLAGSATGRTSTATSPTRSSRTTIGSSCR